MSPRRWKRAERCDACGRRIRLRKPGPPVKEARTIAGYISQQRHKDFVDRFERELADRPAATANPADAEVGA